MRVPASFEQALRDCTARLEEVAGRALWTPECHPVLLRAGRASKRAGSPGPPPRYWQRMLETNQAELGPDHAHTILARDRLGAAHEAAGRPDDAVEVYQESLNERQRILGTGHPDTVAARANLAPGVPVAAAPRRRSASPNGSSPSPSRAGGRAIRTP